MLDAVFGYHPAHVNRDFSEASAVVHLGKYVAMDVDHRCDSFKPISTSGR
jgi:hypothetical protein